jgi:hypothetical protein
MPIDGLAVRWGARGLPALFMEGRGAVRQPSSHPTRRVPAFISFYASSPDRMLPEIASNSAYGPCFVFRCRSRAFATGPSPFRDGRADPPARAREASRLPWPMPPGPTTARCLVPGREFGTQRQFKCRGDRWPVRERDPAQRRRHISLKDRPDGTANLCICHLPPSDQRRPTPTEASVALGACGGRRRCGAGGHYWPRARQSRRWSLSGGATFVGVPPMDLPPAMSNSPSTENLKRSATMQHELKT